MVVKMSRRALTIGAAAIAAVAVAVSAYAVYKNVRAIEATAATARACTELRDLNMVRSDNSPVSQGSVVAVILGDSYAQGQHLDDPRTEAWSTLVGEAAGWETHVDAFGGTGVTSAGPCGREDFASRLPAALTVDPEVLIVQTGLNDQPERAGEALQELVADIGRARVIVIGPVLAPAYDEDTVKSTDAALAEAAQNASVEYISMLDFTPEYGPDQRHMTAQGHREYADHVLEELSVS